MAIVNDDALYAFLVLTLFGHIELCGRGPVKNMEGGPADMKARRGGAGSSAICGAPDWGGRGRHRKAESKDPVLFVAGWML